MTRRLQVLFLLALLGVVVMFGVALWRLLGPVGAVGYAVAVVALLGYGARRARAAARPVGRTCACCTGTVHDPVRVL